MYRNRYYQKSYSKYSSNKTSQNTLFNLNRTFYPILNDLRRKFFNLTTCELNQVLGAYRAEYGESAYNYALKTYPYWKRGSTSLSAQTFFRLINVLPSFMTSSERIELLKKLYTYHKPRLNLQHRYITTSWNEFNVHFNNIKTQISNNFNTDIDNYQSLVQLPQEIISAANWLCNNDMIVAQKIHTDFLKAQFKETTVSALRDLSLFQQKCCDMYSQGLIYQDINLSLTFPTYIINIHINKTEKTFLQKLTDFFR